MRILHFADLHIGVETHGRPATLEDLAALPDSFAPGLDRERTYTGMSTRLLDFLAAFDALVDFAIRERVDLVLFSGDAYKSRNPTQTHQREFARRIARLTSAGIPVFLLTGNHDMPHAPGLATALDIFPTLSHPLVHVADTLRLHSVQTTSGPIQVISLPWIRRSALLASEDARSLSPDALRRHIEDRITHRLQDAASALDPSIPAVVAAHVTVQGATVGTEQSMMLTQDHVLMPSALALPGVDYVALGHIHRHQPISQRPPMVYPGSLQRVDFSEEDDEKGFCLVELNASEPPGQRVRWEFVPVPARPFLTIDVQIDQGEDPTQRALQAVAQRVVRDAIVRLRIRLTQDQAAALNDRAIHQALKEAHSVAGVHREIVRERRPRWESISTTTSPFEALELYLRQQEKADPAIRELALRKGRQLIDELSKPD
ncbi:MAG: exonuclease SbcCD subunit D [Chloroflexi bacterium]|nr:exonuclease SbcCD subunit D [Chloroflexota bacterium]